MFKLIVRSHEGATATAELSSRPITLGRAETCDVVLRSDGEVSRVHAEVWLDEHGRVLVADKDSKNGTRVDNGEAFRNDVRPANQWIRVGDYELEILGGRVGAIDDTQTIFQPDEDTTGTGNTRYYPSTRHLDLSQQRLSLLMSLTERIGGAFEQKQLLEQALDACCEALGFERGLIVLRTPRGDPELPVTRNVERDESGAYKVSRTLINRALVDGQRAVVNNPAVDLVDNLTESLVRFPICSALCVPITHRDEILGAMYGDRITRAATYSSEDVDFLAAIARQVGVGLANLRLFKAHLQAEKMYLELDRARTIQRALLPHGPLEMGRVILDGHNEPSSAVGGDYFDYFDLGGDRVGLTIADVTGHGLPAALMMANFQAAVRVALTAEIPLPELGTRLNRLICENTGSSIFITGIVGRLDTVTGAVEYINAGHPAPLLLRGEQVRPGDDGRSLPLGIEPDEKFSVQWIEPSAELDAALFYTDGLTEAANPAGHLLDVAPVMDALAAAPARSTEALLRTTLNLVRHHLADNKNNDDLTLLALQYAQ